MNQPIRELVEVTDYFNLIVRHHGETEEDIHVYSECLLAHAVSSIEVTSSEGRIRIKAVFTPELQDIDESQYLAVLTDLQESLRTAICHCREYYQFMASAA